MKKKFLLSSLFLGICVFINAQTSVWKVTDGNHTLYLGGSVHLLRQSDFPLPTEFNVAFEKSAVVVFETDLEQLQNPQIAQKMMAKAMFAEGKTLKSVLADSVYNQLDKAFAKFGVPLASLNNFKAGMVLTVLMGMELQTMGMVSNGVDMTFYELTKQENKTVEFLEDVDLQLDIITNMGAGFENEYVAYSLQDLENTQNELEKMINDWKSGTSDYIEESLKAMQKFPLTYAQLLTQRNNAWMPKIEQYLKSQNTAFVVVGLLHFYGADGILQQLQSKGYKIEPVMQKK